MCIYCEYSDTNNNKLSNGINARIEIFLTFRLLNQNFKDVKSVFKKSGKLFVIV